MTEMVLVFYCNWAVLLCLSVQAYENLALHQTTWQSSTWSYYGLSCTADRAVDGRYTDLAWYGGQCAVSSPGQTTAEWWVDLGGVKYIHHVTIRHVDKNPGFFLGFSVYISNTTAKEDGALGFKDTNYTRATIPNPVNITCPYHGRYVIYYNTRTHPPYPNDYSSFTDISLCEVEVYGCRSLRNYGENCSLECPQNCQNGYCDIVEGTCLACKPGFIGSRCIGCAAGLYGSNCSKNCSMTCGNPGVCHKDTGHCNGSCLAGWEGDMCDNECSIGFHGVNCLQNCSMACGIPGNCDKITGYCNGGCQRGWTGVICEKECAAGLFGNNCSKNCSLTCRDPGVCDKVTGHCNGSCLAGWEGDMCENECSKGFYGVNCVENCSMTCGIPGNCDKITGYCNGGCQRGWTGVNCEEEHSKMRRILLSSSPWMKEGYRGQIV
uniref:Multiple epidermal growth factor-like domains protein 10 isoform X2 n=1 Tax=Crassostrea virginica TaxID=6565 RepID=A0A8B8BMN0_CRAVI|nr:multiple epidermal growth factor-like domains protein 10 isoform X2 [Crassostrea virginica]